MLVIFSWFSFFIYIIKFYVIIQSLQNLQIPREKGETMENKKANVESTEKNNLDEEDIKEVNGGQRDNDIPYN